MVREVQKKTNKTRKKKKDDKVAYTPKSEKEVNAEIKRLIQGLRDGTIKVPHRGQGGTMTWKDFTNTR